MKKLILLAFALFFGKPLLVAQNRIGFQVNYTHIQEFTEFSNSLNFLSVGTNARLFAQMYASISLGFTRTKTTQEGRPVLQSAPFLDKNGYYNYTATNIDYYIPLVFYYQFKPLKKLYIAPEAGIEEYIFTENLKSNIDDKTQSESHHSYTLLTGIRLSSQITKHIDAFGNFEVMIPPLTEDYRIQIPFMQVNIGLNYRL